MKLRIPPKLELQDVQSVTVDLRRRVFGDQEKDDTSAWFADTLLLVKNTPKYLSKSSANFRS